MNISTQLLEYIRTKDISVEEFIYLYSRLLKIGWEKHLADLQQSLKDKSYLLSSGKVSSKGKDLIKEGLSGIGLITSSDFEEKFKEFWDLFPESDGWGNYSATRQLKTNETKCRDLYRQLLYNEEVEQSSIINGLKAEIKYRQTRSSKENQFRYMKNSVNYLNDKAFTIWTIDENKSTIKHNIT